LSERVSGELGESLLIMVQQVAAKVPDKADYRKNQ